MIWVWAALLVLGLALLVLTLVRVLAGGLAGSPARSATSGQPDRSGTDPGAGPGLSRARQLLDERYASGELTTQEYEHRRAVLSRQEET